MRPLSTALRHSARRASTSAGALSRTPLYALHQEHQAKLSPFAGFMMPLYYDKGGAEEHRHVRNKAGLFDVSHMVQSQIAGKGATEFLNWITPSSIAALAYGENNFYSTLSVLLNPAGGILDDLMITRQGAEQYYVVTNAGRRAEDLAWISQQLEEFNQQHGTEVSFRVIEDKALVALQGPTAVQALQGLAPQADLSKLYFGQSLNTPVSDLNCHVARSGYTGEDGFEISVPAEQSIAFCERLLESAPDVALAGLAARDSLRIEAGLCLYGHDIDEHTTPVQGALSWLVGKDKRDPAGQFIGSEAVLAQLQKGGIGPGKRRVGLTVEKGAPAREGSLIFDASGEQQIGVVTSGIPSPTLGTNIAMGYVEDGMHKKDTEVTVQVRNKMRKAVITKMPFVPAKYYKGV